MEQQVGSPHAFWHMAFRRESHALDAISAKMWEDSVS